MIPEQTGTLDAEATGGIAGRNIEHRGRPTPPLPLDRQSMQEAGVVTQEAFSILEVLLCIWIVMIV